MISRFGVRGVTALTAAVAAALLFSVGSHGQAQTPAPPTYKAVRLPYGGDVPNLNGTWQVSNTANWDLQDHQGARSPILAMGGWGAIPPGLSVVDGNEIPYKPEALAKKNANFQKRMELDPEMKCYLPGVPRAVYMPYPFKIVQTSSQILMNFAYANTTRVIDMTKVPKAPVDTWMGYSSGKWEKDTLVVESRGFNDRTWFDRAGNFHSDALRVTERFTPISADALNYEATMTDPNVFTRPWKISMPLYRRVGRDAELLEFNCVEYVEEFMYGDLVKKPTK
jgi:hypothetical protein